MEKKLNSIISYLFVGFIFIIPLIFSASPLVSFQFSKIIPFFIVTFLAAFFFIIRIFNDGKMEIPMHGVFAAMLAVPVIYVLSAFFSVNRVGSFLGTGIELGTASMIGGFFLFMYFVSLFMRSKEKVFLAYMAFAAAFLILAVFHILRFMFGADFLSFGIFTNIISNTIGRFSDLGLVAGIATLLSLTSIEFLRLEKMLKVLAYTVLVLSLVMLAAANFPIIVWGTGAATSLSLFTFIGLFALVFFVYFVSSSYGKAKKVAASEKEEETAVVSKTGRRIPMASLAVLVLSIVITLGGLPLQNALASFFKIEPTAEIRLLWEPTATLSGSTISQLSVRPLLGYGPEQFAYKWMLDKPEDINNTIVWNTPFNYGVGFIPSAIVTVGLLGFLAWVAFIGLFVWVGSRALFMKIKDPFSHYLMASSFLVSLYLWFAAIVYIPSITTFLLTFFFTGLFFASLSRESVIREKALVFDNSKKKSFVFIMALILALMLLILWGYKIGERVVASVYASKGNIALSTAQSMDDVEKAKSYFNTARSLANDSTYSLLLANIALAQINGIIQDTTTPVEKLREDFQARYQEAMAYSENAIRTNPRSYEAYVTYGNILAIGASLGVQGHYEQAKASYEKAAELNPKSPLIPYLLAQLEVTASNISGAKTKLGDALTLKPNFIDAIIYLGRIQVGEGKIQDAIASFTVALSLDPQNEDLKTILNTLKTQGGSSATQTSDNQTATSTGATKNATSTNN